MLRQLQKKRIKKLLHTTEPWKILILDTRTQQILSPLLRINELRECNVTSHFLISRPRYPIKDTAAIYFVSDPSPILRDILNNLYSAYYLNFSTSITRKDLEYLSYNLSNKGLALQVKWVYDQFLDFISLQDDLFSLELSKSYVEVDVKTVVLSLLSVFITLDEMPYIISGEDATCEEIGELLETKIRNTRILKKSLKRPVLIIVNRNYDIISPVQHVWTYSALINDLLDFKSNKVTLNQKTFDLYPEDELWHQNKNEYFPVVAENVEKELLEYKKELALRSITEKSDKRLIQETLDKAPLLAKKNEVVNAHFSICMKMLEIIKKRSIDDFYRLEKGSYKTSELLELSEKGNDEDILRLAISLCRTKDCDVAGALLEKRKICTKVLEYFKNHKSVEQVKNDTLYSRVTTGIMGNVKRLLPVKETSPISELTESVYNSIRAQDYKGLQVFDACKASSFYASEISQIVVFCVGGATYSELNTLRLLSEKIKVPITYGGTEILNASSFISQIKELDK